MGNHDYYQTGYNEQGAEKFKQYSGYNSVDYSTTIGGYHFIFVSLDQYDKSHYAFFSESKLNWLKNELDKAVKDTPDKQVFVFSLIFHLMTHFYIQLPAMAIKI